MSTPQTLGSKIDQYYELRESKRELDEKVKSYAEMMKVLELELIEMLDEAETDLSRGRLASASIAETTIAEVEDWDELRKYILKNDSLHLLQNRVSNAAWNELRNAGEEIPGTKPLIRRSISVRKVPKK